MVWTKEKPTAPGLYFIRQNIQGAGRPIHSINIVRVTEEPWNYKNSTALYVSFCGCGTLEMRSAWSGYEWAGPIPYPDEASENVPPLDDLEAFKQTPLGSYLEAGE